eukprot:gnl/Spiro4/13966_TR7477_c0_g1_i1.p4 gnl/Spiro4/13966_TR7477_c0_g1~~gnl/Spiro4/13966_TR7477_c0_g1_i1.p4  ORF type:complete len:372 (+),score=46.35 gnl/Spiro4/13966_TR7477_c0_g1_i1:14788-15903(+)
MQYPVLNHIDQVREAIKDRPEFIEAVRDEYHVFNYMVAHTDSFDCPIRRECRGLIFDKEGKVLSRRFHKFFNQGEKPETTNIDWSQPHVVLEKLDGSMITPLFLPSGLRWATKMGVTSYSEEVEKFVAKKPEYVRLAKHLQSCNMTPIFEYMGPSNRIVLDYKEERLVLLAIRENRTGKYMSDNFLTAVDKEYGVSVVQPYHGSLDDLKNEIGIEGVVVRFDDGHMIKVKTDWYCAIHKAKENILFEKNVIKLILEEKLDDIVPHLMDDDRKRLEEYQRELLIAVDNVTSYVEYILDTCERQSIDRKQFALKHADKIDKIERALVFACWGDKPVRPEVIKTFLRHTGSQTDVEVLREWIDVKWNPTGVIND